MEEDDSVADFKKELRDKLDELNNTLNHYLAGEYGIDPKNKTKYENWLKTHQPFHWFVEFYGILAKGGFDVIIGNPPYIEYSKVRKEYKILNYKTEKCGNLYAFCMERSNNLVSKFGFYSMIVPISISCSSRMKPAQNILKIRGAYISNYSWRPAKLFEGSKKANLSLSVFITNSSKEIFTTNYLRWYSNNRYGLFPTINYTKIQTQKYEQIYQKIGSKLDLSIYEKIVQFANIDKKLSSRKTENILYYRRTGGLYWKIFTDFQPIVYLNGNKTVSSKEANLFFENQGDLKITIAILWSDIYWWWYIINSDVRNNNPFDLKSFPVPTDIFNNLKISKLSESLITDLVDGSKWDERKFQGNISKFQKFYPKHSKNIINDIDIEIFSYYGLDEIEIDYLINYEIKFRMGDD